MSSKKTIPLNDFITLQRGFDLPRNDRQDGVIPVVASTGVGGYHNEAKATAPGVVIGRSGSIGGGQYITEDFWPLNTTLWVKDFKGHNPRYVYYLMRSIDFSTFNVGTGVPTLNRNHLSSVDVTVLDEASEIYVTKCLGSLDDKIQLNHEINQTLEEIAQAIFKNWFVDFEPTRAKIIAKEQGADLATQELAAQAIICGAITLEQLAEVEHNLETTLQQAIDEKLSQDPQTPVNAEQLKATAALFPSAMVESELGEIPEGWQCQALSGWGDIVCGKTPLKRKDEYYGGDVPFIKIPDMHGNMFATHTVDSLTSEGAASQPKKAIPKGSICVSCIATVGLVVIATEESHTNQQINSIVPEKETYTPYLYFRMQSLNRYLYELASGGSATLNLNTGNFSKIEVLKPSADILNRFHELTAPMLNKILENTLASQTLSELRDTLLPKLLSGELAVTDNPAPAIKDEEALNV